MELFVRLLNLVLSFVWEMFVAIVAGLWNNPVLLWTLVVVAVVAIAVGKIKNKIY